jgi:hypothetical protein
MDGETGGEKEIMDGHMERKLKVGELVEWFEKKREKNC